MTVEQHQRIEHQHDWNAMIIDNGADQPTGYLIRCARGAWFYPPTPAHQPREEAS